MKRSLKWLSLLAFALAGCGNTAGVAVTFQNPTMVMPDPGGGFAAMKGTATLGADNTLDLHAENGTAILDVSLDAPTMAGPVMVGERHLQVSYSIGTGSTAPGWASTAGGITFESLSPYQVRFDNVEMLHATPQSQGVFYLSGSGTFTQ